MPLLKSKSPEAFKKNLKTEMSAGKPMKQSLAIAYALKKKAKKMADGGDVQSPPQQPIVDPDLYKKRMASIIKMGKPTGYAEGGDVHKNEMSDQAKKNAEEMQKGATSGEYPIEQLAKNFKEGLGYAEGGQIKGNYQSKNNPHEDGSFPDIKHQYDEEFSSGFVDHEGDVKRPSHMAMEEDDRDLGEHGEEEQGPYGTMMADGGQIMDNEQDDAHEMDMVGRIMKQRQMHYSKGGRVANSGEGDLDEMADGKVNNFDDLSLRDDLESSYTGANSGDEIGNDGEDKRRSDIISRIMMSRRKKDRMPHPA